MDTLPEIDTPDPVILIQAADLPGRLEQLGLWIRDPEILDGVELLISDIEDHITAEELNERLETLPDLCPTLDRARWGLVFEHILPELYCAPKVSKKISEAVPGTRSMQWRLRERARCGLALHHPRDTSGVQEPVQTTFC